MPLAVSQSLKLSSSRAYISAQRLSGFLRFVGGSDKYDAVFVKYVGMASAVSFGRVLGTLKIVPSSRVMQSIRMRNCSEKCFSHTTVLALMIKFSLGISLSYRYRISMSFGNLKTDTFSNVGYSFVGS